MLFCPNEAPVHLEGQRLLWNLLQRALRLEDGSTWFRYPIFAADDPARRRPDFLVASRTLGLWLIACRGTRVDDFDPGRAQEHLALLAAQGDALEKRCAAEPGLAGIDCRANIRLALPFVKTPAQALVQAASEPEVERRILTFDDLRPAALSRHLASTGGPAASWTEAQWALVLATLRGSLPSHESRPAPESAPEDSPLRWLAALRRAPRWLDDVQERVANEIPEGPQRIRGVAGSGKTLLLARRAALIHAVHPDWDVAVVHPQRGAEQRLWELVASCYRRLTGTAPDAGRLRIWHAWGNDAATGFYREAARAWTGRMLTTADAQNRLGWRLAASQGFEWACGQLEADLGETVAEPFLDAILIDAGQDLPPACYRLAYRALRAPRRLYWTHDDAQGMDNLVIPRAASIFGLHPDGSPRLDLSGQYPSGIPRARNLRRGYRTPSSIFTVAEALVMGLQRKGGPLQAVTHRDEWNGLGFLAEGDFTARGIRFGRPIALHPDPDASGHPYDHRKMPDAAEQEPALLTMVETTEEQATIAALMHGLRADLEAGFMPEDLLVVVPSQAQPSPEKLRIALNHAGIEAFVPGLTGAFRQPGCVTICNVEAARGQEAWKVYACALQRVTAESVVDPDDAILRRNQAFVALTRSRMWCVAIGESGPFMDELAGLLRHGPGVTFRAVPSSELHRDLSYWLLTGSDGRGGEPPRELS
ncbi:MAG: hypothetical protein EA417_21785 [Gammaproteobacteria bacterium]|nr:MAG: hypothetical protein EA417_21785 [Gammaproteobacteria bacterium]